MLRKLQFVTLITALSLLASCAQTSTSNAPLPQVGTKVSGIFEIGPSQVPLPPGEWTIASTTNDRSTRGDGLFPIPTPITRVVLIQVVNGVVGGAVTVHRNPESGSGGWSRVPECDRTDMHFVRSDKNYNPRDTECVWLNHVVMTRGAGGAPWFTQALDYTSQIGAKIPCTVLTEEYYLVAGTNFLYAAYALNPEVHGFAPTTSCEWRGNDWHKDRVGSDPKKVAFIDSMRQELIARLPAVKEGFAGRLKAQ